MGCLATGAVTFFCESYWLAGNCDLIGVGWYSHAFVCVLWGGCQIYNRIVQNAFQPKPDNLTLVEDILDTFGPQARPDLADLIQPWQQFIGVCNVTELEDLGRPSLRGKHCRTFFLFNEYLLVAKAKGSHKYALRQVSQTPALSLVLLLCSQLP